MNILDKLFGKKQSATSNISLKQTLDEPISNNSVGPLVAELIEIGIRTKRYVSEYEGYIYYFRPKGEGIGPDKDWDARTREIGEELYRLGEGKIQLMQNGHSSVIKILGPLAGRYLEAHWHEIGLEQFRQGKGEVWLS
jgi:hypothetical protein